MNRILKSLISYSLIFILTLIYLIPIVIILILPSRLVLGSKLVCGLVRSFCKALLWCSFLPITFKGEKYIDQEPVIVVSNHQSALDIPLIATRMRNGYVWLASTYLNRFFHLRIILPKLAVLVDTTTPMTGMRTLIQAIEIIKQKKVSAIIFPEGQRYTDGSVHDFFGGFVILAKKTKLPVVPVKIINACAVYPPGAWWAHYQRITVVIGPKMIMQPEQSDDDFKMHVYQWFINTE